MPIRLAVCHDGYCETGTTPAIFLVSTKRSYKDLRSFLRSFRKAFDKSCSWFRSEESTSCPHKITKGDKFCRVCGKRVQKAPPPLVYHHFYEMFSTTASTLEIDYQTLLDSGWELWDVGNLLLRKPKEAVVIPFHAGYLVELSGAGKDVLSYLKEDFPEIFYLAAIALEEVQGAGEIDKGVWEDTIFSNLTPEERKGFILSA